MKPRPAVVLAGIVILIAIQVGCSQGYQGAGGPGQHPLLDHNPHRIVTIADVTQNVSNPCEVDFPVTLLRITKGHTIAWYASDHDYWIWFDHGSPIVGGTNAIKVTKGSSPTDYGVTLPSSTTNEQYFTYAIYDADPGPNPSPAAACKQSGDDHDTGVNVKR